MAITSTNELSRGIRSKYTDFTISKNSLGNTAGGQYFSLWQASGFPIAGATPTGVGTGPIVVNNTTTGTISLTNRTAPVKNYISDIEVSTANALISLEIHDRLAHQGGFSGIVTTAQIASFDFSSLSLSNISERKGDANYSDIQWWLEWYTATGATASNATINVTFNDATTGNLTVVAVGGTVRAGRMIPLNSLVAAADQGKFIRGINNITLSASTGTAGNFGFTATRYRCSLLTRTANVRYQRTWEQIGFPEIYSESGLFPVALVGNSTTTGIIQANGKLVYG